MLYLNYIDDETGGEIRKGQEDEPWPSYEDINHSYVFKNLSLREQYPSQKFDINANIGDVFHIVVVYYDTGDSYGNVNNVIYFEDIYLDIDEAEAVAKSIMDDTYSEGYIAWKGYFECLRDVEVLSMSVRIE